MGERGAESQGDEEEVGESERKWKRGTALDESSVGAGSQPSQAKANAMWASEARGGKQRPPSDDRRRLALLPTLYTS